MYNKDLTDGLRLRLSRSDMDFLRSLSDKRNQTISECIRGIIGEYRRSIESLDILKTALQTLKEKGALSDGDTKTDFNDKL